MSEKPTILVLGASGVLGKSISESFQEKGWKVLGTGFQKKSSTTPSLQIDLTLASEMTRLEKWIREHTSHLDAMIHCVGSTSDHLMAQTNDSDWEQVIDSNLKSAYLVSKLLLPWFMKQRKGHLIFIGSWGGRVGRAGQTNYGSAKAGLMALIQSIAREYASRGIVANGIIPGIFRSPMTENLSQQALEEIWKDSVLKQFADFNELSAFILHLASMKGVTGQIFQLDGRIPPFG